MLGSDRASWQNPKVLTTLLLVFLAGACAGALAMRSYGLTRINHSATLALRPEGRDAFLLRCKKELNLTPTQAQRITGVLDDYKSYYDNLEDQLEEIRATGKDRIMRVLDDRQKAKFEEMLAEMQRK
jgi:hypothetical protein